MPARPERRVQGRCSILSGSAYSLMLVRRLHDFFFRQKKLKASAGEADEEHTDMSSMVLLSVCPRLSHSAPSSTPSGTEHVLSGLLVSREMEAKAPLLGRGK